jgi:hypothetical protein
MAAGLRPVGRAARSGEVRMRAWVSVMAWSIGCLGLAAVRDAMAGDAPRVELTPFYGYRMGGQFDVDNPPPGTASSADLNASGAWGMDLGIYRDRNSFYEILYSHQATGLNVRDTSLKGVDVTVQYLQAGGTLLFPGKGRAVPYLSLTVGATMFGANGGYGSETKFSASLGGGVRIPFNDHVAATIGARGYLTVVNSDTSFFCAGGNGTATCLLRTSGSTFFQGEALAGLTVVF